MKLPSLLTGCLLAGLVCAPARTWTRADGAKTFEGDLKEFDDSSGKVTIIVNGRQLLFDEDKLSEDDRSFLVEWNAEASKPTTVGKVLESQKIGKKLTSQVLSRFDGKKFKKASMEKAPKYYLLYFSASW